MPKTILIVEDEIFVAMDIERILADAGFSARNGTKVFYVTANPAQIDPIAPTAIGYIQKPFSESAIRAAARIAAQQPGERDADHAEVRLF